MVTPKRRTRCSQYEVWGDVVSDTFVNSWTEDVPRVQQTCSPCYERPNFVYGLLDYLFAKETVTRNAVVGTDQSSWAAGCPITSSTPQLTTGYTELVRLLKEPTTDGQHYANFAHELDPEMPGLVVVWCTTA